MNLQAVWIDLADEVLERQTGGTEVGAAETSLLHRRILSMSVTLRLRLCPTFGFIEPMLVQHGIAVVLECEEHCARQCLDCFDLCALRRLQFLPRIFCVFVLLDGAFCSESTAV